MPKTKKARTNMGDGPGAVERASEAHAPKLRQDVAITAATGRPMLTWVGKRPLRHVTAFPAQLVEVFDPAGKVQRTLIAALELFRDRILAEAPEAVESGEWCSPEEVNDLIAHISAQPPAPPMASGV